MIPKGLFAQIIIILLAIGIAFFFIQPRFDEISSIQDDIVLYQEQIDNVSEVNENLAALVSRLTSIPAQDRVRLNTYLPDEIDQVGIVRDLFLMTRLTQTVFIDANFSTDDRQSRNRNSQAQAEADELRQPVPHEFALSVEG